MDRHIKAPFNEDEVKTLKAGDYVYISGTIYTARDAAHKRMYEASYFLSSKFSSVPGYHLITSIFLRSYY